MKKWVHKVLRYIVTAYYIKRQIKLLSLFHNLGIDLSLGSLPAFKYYNRAAFKKLKRLKAQNKQPYIVYHVDESDGRFERYNELSATDDEVVVFRFAPHLMNAEKFVFAEYAKAPIGFYDDARQKYRQESNWQNRLNYRKYVTKMFDLFEKSTGKVDIFMSGSNNDRFIVEMIYVAQERGTSWVVAEREGTGTLFTYEFEGRCFKESDSIQAHYIFCANDRHRDMFNHAKKDSVRFVKTIGELDSDWWFHWDRQFVRKEYRQWDHYRKKVLFLTFGDRNYIEPYLYPQYPDLNWKPLMRDCEEVLFNYAQQNPDILVFYKMGHLEDYNLAFMQKCEAANLTNILPLNRTFPCSELILYSDIVIGFQTTAMFEAMFSDKVLVQLDWHIPDILDRETQLLPINKYGAVLPARSKQELKAFLDDVAAGKLDSYQVPEEMKAARKKTREIMFYDADGRTAERFYQEVKTLLKERRPV